MQSVRLLRVLRLLRLRYSFAPDMCAATSQVRPALTVEPQASKLPQAPQNRHILKKASKSGLTLFKRPLLKGASMILRYSECK